MEPLLNVQTAWPVVVVVESTGFAPKDNINFKSASDIEVVPDTETESTDIETTSVTSESETVRLPEVTRAEFVSFNDAASKLPVDTVIDGILALTTMLFRFAKL